MDRAARRDAAAPAPSLGLSYPRSYRDVAPDGLLGNAAIATAEKGIRIIEATVDALEEFVRSPEFSVEAREVAATT